MKNVLCSADARLIKVYSAFLLLLSTIASEAIGSCPIRALGVEKVNGASGSIFYSTAFARPMSDHRESLDDAQSSARLSARILLKSDSRIPRAKNGVLYGVKDEESCETDGRFYATVSISEKSALQAIKLKEKIDLSFTDNPTPKIEGYSWIDGGK